MTFYNNTMSADCGTNANLQAWVSFIDSSLIAGGWIATSDIQTPITGFTVPTASQQKRGYRVYQLADDLQGQYPVIIRIDFGSGFSNFGAPYSPAVWLTIGIRSDGNGNLSNLWLNSAYVESHQSGGLATCVASVDTGRCTFGMFCGTGSQPGNTNAGAFAFSIERWKDELGQDTGDGLLIVYSSRQSVQSNVQICLAYSPSVYFEASLLRQQPIDLGINYIHTSIDASPTYFGDRGVGVLFHFFGTALQPGKNWLICNATDTAGPILAVNIYGELIPYVAVNLIPFCGLISGNSFGDTYRKVLMRYD